jgi:hypothetical protein
LRPRELVEEWSSGDQNAPACLADTDEQAISREDLGGKPLSTAFTAA